MTSPAPIAVTGPVHIYSGLDVAEVRFRERNVSFVCRDGRVLVLDGPFILRWEAEIAAEAGRGATRNDAAIMAALSRRAASPVPSASERAQATKDAAASGIARWRAKRAGRQLVRLLGVVAYWSLVTVAALFVLALTATAGTVAAAAWLVWKGVTSAGSWLRDLLAAAPEEA